MKKIIITGAGGFIGSALANYYLQREYLVVGADVEGCTFNRIHPSNNFIGCTIKEIDYSNTDIVFHLAWGLMNYNKGNSVDDCLFQLQNISLAVEVMNGAIANKVKKFVFVGTNYEEMFSLSNGHKLATNAFSNIYGIGKRTAADFCRKLAIDAGMSFNQALLANTYGVGDYSKKAVNTFITKLLANEDLFLIDGNNATDWMYIDDTVYGLFCIGKEGVNVKDYYIGHQVIPTFRDNICILHSLIETKSNLYFGKFKEKEYIDYSKIDTNALYKDTSFRCKYTIQMGLTKTIEWIKSMDREEKE